MRVLTNRFTIISAAIIVVALAFLIIPRPRQTQAQGTVYFYPGDNPQILAISSDGSTLYAAISSGGIAVIDKNTMEKVDVISFPYLFWDMEIDPSGEYIYCTYPTGDDGTGHLSRIRLSDENVETIDLSPVNVSDLTFDDSGEYAYVCGGTWPHVGVGYDGGDYIYHLDSGRIFEVRTSDFVLTRTVNVGIDNNGISYQDGKLVIMSIEDRARGTIQGGDGVWYEVGNATTCHVIDAGSLETEHTIAVNPGSYNTSHALPGDTYVMGGFNCVGDDGAGLGLINIHTGEVEHWYITDPTRFKPAGGGFRMAVDEANHILYSTLYCLKNLGQSHYRFGVINLTTNEYSDWLVEPFRIYLDILFDPTSGKVFLTAPEDDAIVVLEPPQ